MRLLRLGLVLFFAGVSAAPTPAWADVAQGDTSNNGGTDTGEDDKDSGCTVVAATTSVGALGLGLALVFGVRRRED